MRPPFWLCACWVLALAGGAAWAEPAATPDAGDNVMVQTYRHAVAINPNDVIAYFNLGLALYKQERYPEAQDVLKHCLELNRGDARSHQQVDGPANQILGIINFNVNRDDKQAVEYFQRSLQSLPNDPDTYYALGLAFARLDNPAQALQAFDRVLALGRTQDADVYLQRGLALAKLSREPEAAASYADALKRKPDLAPALENLALVYHHQGKNDETIAVLQRLLKLDPNNFNAYYLLGLHYFQKKMYSEMVAAYTRAVAMKPDLADAHYNLGMAYYFQTRYDQAVDELKKAVALNSQDAEAYTLLGQAQTAAIDTYLHDGGTYLAQEKYRDAITELQKIFAIDPNHARAKTMLEDAQRLLRESYAEHLRLGDKFLAENKVADAYNEYEQAAALNPDSPEAQAGRRKTSAQIGQLLSQRLQKARDAEQAKDYAEAQAQYASALQLKSDYAPAKKALAALQGKLRQEWKRLLALAASEAEQDRVSEAASAYRRVLRLLQEQPDADAQERVMTGLARVNARREELIRQNLALGKKYLAAGAEGQAKAAFMRVLQLDPQNARANESIVKLTGAQAQAKVTDEEIKTTYYRGVDAYVNGKIEEAIREWEKVIQLDPENQDARINITRAKAKLAAIRKLTEGY